MSQEKIVVRNLVRLFGPVRAVDNISFQVEQGEIVGFLGPNGAGKTTTMRILTGFLPPTAGEVRVAGYDVQEQSLEARRRLGYLPENVPLYGEMRVEEYLDYRARLKGLPRRVRQKRIEYVIERCRLQEMRRRLCGTLSKGYRQRVGLADALIHDPDILILDEPTVGLDPIQVRETREVIRELREHHTVLLSTHILPEVQMLCQRVIIIHRGRIVLDDRLDRIRRSRVVDVEIAVNGTPVENVRSVLKAVPGVKDVRVRDGGWFQVLLDGDQDPRAMIAQTVVQNGWQLQSLTLREETLEDRFVEVVVRSDE